MSKKNVQTKLQTLIFWLIWPILVFFGTQFLLTMILKIIFGNSLAQIALSPIFSAVYPAVMYLVILLALILIPNKFFAHKITKREIALTGWPKWADIGLGICGFIVAMIIAGILTQLASSFAPGFEIDQAQDVGFSNMTQGYQLVLAFAALVIVAPLAEEVIFRGVMFGKLRKFSPWFAMLLVSLLFGLAHGQLNVGITTFAMSLVMCFIREKLTDTIWAGIILHGLKNAIAFYMLFIAPNLLPIVTG